MAQLEVEITATGYVLYRDGTNGRQILERFNTGPTGTQKVLATLQRELGRDEDLTVTSSVQDAETASCLKSAVEEAGHSDRRLQSFAGQLGSPDHGDAARSSSTTRSPAERTSATTDRTEAVGASSNEAGGPQAVAAGTHAAPAGAPSTADDAAVDALATLHDRSRDVLAGFDKMVEKAQPEFRPTAESFRQLHQRQASRLSDMLAKAGRRPDDEGTFMSTVNRTVVTLRSMFDSIDEDVMKQIQDGEQHVLDAFDDALQQSRGEVHDELARMRQELTDLLAEAPATPT
ncbi:ferritin-like domain-containing protein [Rhodobacter sp. NSM]|uniref:ferritin-like domain-containing protein n=1 Tax=Rhodobacter sp. NSM TaxID=3457501 RepID=UPI003FD0C745